MALKEIVESSSAKFFSLFPEAATPHEMQKMNNHFHFQRPFNGDANDFGILNNQIYVSVSVQLLQLKIWSLFIDSLKASNNYGSPGKYAKHHIKKIKNLKAFRELSMSEEHISTFIEELQPIFCKVCKRVSSLREIAPAAAAAAASPRDKSSTYVENLLARRHRESIHQAVE